MNTLTNTQYKYYLAQIAGYTPYIIPGTIDIVISKNNSRVGYWNPEENPFQCEKALCGILLTYSLSLGHEVSYELNGDIWNKYMFITYEVNKGLEYEIMFEIEGDSLSELFWSAAKLLFKEIYGYSTSIQ